VTAVTDETFPELAHYPDESSSSAGKPARSLPMRDDQGLHAELAGDLDTRNQSLVIHALLIPPTIGSHLTLCLRREVPKSYQARWLRGFALCGRDA